jgi:recombination protein RecR
MDSIQKLTELFKQFPGIGPRQAKRFVYFLLTQKNGYTGELSGLISELKKEIFCCEKCFRFFPRTAKGGSDDRASGVRFSPPNICSICSDSSRDKSLLMIVSRDVDFENIEKTKSYNGYYFILGGTIPILEENPSQKIRQKELLDVISTKIKEGVPDQSETGLREVILALDANPEGENTKEHVERLIGPLSIQHGFRISTLGRGLSTGAELEYSDPDTLRSALQSRK